MKSTILTSLLFALLLLLQSSCSRTGVHWLDWDEWNKKAMLADKKGLVYIHSPTCDDCKEMSNEVFVDPAIIEYLNEHFYTIKLDVDHQEPIETKGRVWKVKRNKEGNPYHELVAALCQSETIVSYPTVAFLNENFDLIVPIPRKLTANELLMLLNYVATDSFEHMPVEQFQKEFELQ